MEVRGVGDGGSVQQWNEEMMNGAVGGQPSPRSSILGATLFSSVLKAERLKDNYILTVDKAFF